MNGSDLALKAANQKTRSWFTRKASKPATTAPTEVVNPTTAPTATPTVTPAPTVTPTVTPDPTAPTDQPTEVTITDPKELNLFQQFLKKAKSGDLKDVAQSVNGEPDELSIFEQIKKKAKEGDFSDIVKSLPSPPPFPTAIVMQIVSTLNDIFQQNVGKISTFATTAIDTEVAKQKNKLKLNNDMAERATGEALDKHLNIYVTQALT